MGLHHDVGRRSHRRRSVVLLALAVGATLGVAAPQALAGSGDPPLPDLPSITLRVSPMESSPRVAIKVAGEVKPVESVGKFVTLTVQQKSRRGKWTRVSSATVQVLFTPPPEWMGQFNMVVIGPSMSLTGDWKGQVLYESPKMAVFGHYVDYTMTSATGTSASSGGDGPITWTYAGTPLYLNDTPPDTGTLRWYFAENPADIPADNYDGDATHNTEGELMMRDDSVSPAAVFIFHIHRSIAGLLWTPADDPTSLGTRPMLAEDGHMRGTAARPYQGLPLLTQRLDWDLAPRLDSDAVVPYEQRYGDYAWSYTPTKKGLYRMRAAVGGIRSGWRSFTVR
jgi:hypothetical protein